MQCNSTPACKYCGSVFAYRQGKQFCSHPCSTKWRNRPEATTLRFWSYVPARDLPGCWEWQGARHVRGYGAFAWDRRAGYAHRFSWEIHFGAVPEGLQVLHRCDNPACVRPDHLFLGTQADNIADMDAKGRRRSRQEHRRKPPNRICPTCHRAFKVKPCEARIHFCSIACRRQAPSKARPPEDRFWDKVEKGTPDECWQWKGATYAAGYGVIGFQGGTVGAHRVSYALHFGPLPKGAVVSQRCGNRLCVNPAHLVRRR